MEYEEIPFLSREEISSAISDGDVDRRCIALLSAALYQEDWRASQALCLEIMQAEEFSLKRCALIALGHIVRVHRILDLDAVNAATEKYASQKELRGYIENLSSDIRVFYGRNNDNDDNASWEMN